MLMTISVISPASANSKAVTAQSGVAEGGDVAGAGAMFAGLFGQQLSQLATLSSASSAQEGAADGAGAGKKSAKKSELPDVLVPDGQIVALQPVQAAVTPELKLGSELDPAAARQGGDAQEELLAALGTGKRMGAEAQNLPVDSAAIGQFLPVHAQEVGQQAGSVQPASGEQAKVVTLPLPISDSNWAKSMSEQMLSLVSMKADKAHIQINPPELGPIDVTLKLNHDQVQVTFSAASPMAREAVENSLPRLATMLAASGLQLSDAQVSSGQSGDPRQSQRQAKASRQQDEAAVDGSETLSLINKARNMLSIFA